MRGYFGIGVYQPKTEENIGTLWRSAYQLGASFIFIIEKRYKKQCSDTYKTYRHIPLFQFKTLEAFLNSPIYNCQIVSVEMSENSQKLKNFKHPKSCIYLLGSEDNGLPPKLLKNIIVEIPSIRQASYNVAMSGTIIMFDRMTKNL